MAADRADFTFNVRDLSQDTFYIGAVQTAGNKLVFPGLVGFELAPGATKEEAQEIAQYLREHIRGVLYIK
jgi:hypothetical protein